MSNISMSQLVSMVRTMESMGDNPVLEARPAGKLGGASITQLQSPQARANESLIHSLLSTIRSTDGIGKNQMDMASRIFGELAASGTPLSGREVAAALTSVIHSLQTELSPEEGAKTLEDFAATLQSAPLHKLDANSFPPELTRVKQKQVEEFVNVHLDETTVKTSSLPVSSPSVTKIDAALQDIQQFKTQMGGTPHYADGHPSYGPSSKKFFGIPLESCRAWCQKQVESGGFFKGFWKCVGKLFGVSDLPETRFEKASLYLESMRSLAAHRDEIAAAFRRSSSDGSYTMGTLTRLACHPGSNGGPEGMIRNIDSALELFGALYEDAKAKGTLKNFFEALDGVCFENRTTNLQEYAMAHPVGGGAGDTVAQDSPVPGKLVVTLEHVAVHQESDTMMDALAKEIGALITSNEGVKIDWEHGFRPHLMETMIGMERQAVDDKGAPRFKADGSPMRAKITEGDIDRLRTVLNESLFFED